MNMLNNATAAQLERSVANNHRELFALNAGTTPLRNPGVHKSILLAAFFVFILALNCTAQNLPDSLVKKIDALYKKWNEPGSPGCAVGVVRNDSLIFAKGYGMANLEYDNIPNTPETLFHMASVSKQFTAYSIILLARQGKINLDDDIRKYLPSFPDLGVKITVRQLLNHTSGIRDQWQLLAIAGTRLDDVITQEQVIKILNKQQALNFKPGEKFSYSNSGFTLLAEIVRSVTGKTLRKFTDSAIFKPLAMKATHFHNDYTEIENNRAYSYYRKDSAGFSNSILSYSNEGATSLFSNVEDLSKWIMNFYNPKAGDAQDISQLVVKGKLNNRKEIKYALGIVSDNYKNWTQYQHGGSDAGYRTFISIFPDLKMGFIVLGNLGEINTQDKANQMADLFIHDKNPSVTNITEKKTAGKVPAEDLPFLKKQLGDYINAEGNTLSLVLKNDSLFYRPGTDDLLLIKDTAGVYSMFYAPVIKFKFSTGSTDAFTVITPDNDLHFTRYQKKEITDDKVLQQYTGIYHSPELDCNYGIVLKDHKLYLTNSKYSDQELSFAGADHLLDNFWWMSHLHITRNGKDQITGFEVNSGRIMHLRFDKIH